MLTFAGASPVAEVRNELDLITFALFGSGPLAPKLRLFQNNYTPSQASLLADFVQADFSGYAAVAIDGADMMPIRTDAEGNAYRLFSAIYSFVQTATTISNTVYGWYLTNAGGTVYIYGRRFANPIDFSAVDKALDLELAVRQAVDAIKFGDDATVSG